MNVSYSFPPNFPEVVAAFPAAKQKGVVFTYGDTVYNPSKVDICKSLMAHEEVHAKRQTNPVVWWDLYIRDAKFRFKEEALAHQREYQVATEGLGRPLRRRTLASIAKRLCSPLYGGLLGFEEAKRIVQGGEAEVDAFIEANF